MKIIRIILSVIAAALLGAGLVLTSGCGSKGGASSAASAQPKAAYRTLADIKKSGELIIGVFSDKAPF